MHPSQEFPGRRVVAESVNAWTFRVRSCCSPPRRPLQAVWPLWHRRLPILRQALVPRRRVRNVRGAQEPVVVLGFVLQFLRVVRVDVVED